MIVLTGCNSNSGSDSDSKSKKDKHITIGLDPYDYASMPAYVSKEILDNEGLNPEIKEAQVGILFEALSKGEIDAFIDVWTPNLHSTYLKKYGDTFDMAGTIHSNMPLGIAVPKYMKDINTIEDLKKHGAEFDNTVYAIDPGSGMTATTEKMLDVYNMDKFEMKNSTTEAMLVEVKNAIKKKEPIAFDAWRPHPMFVDLDIKFLKDPKNVWKSDEVKVGVTPNLKDKSPEAFKLFSHMKFSLDEVEAWITRVDKGDDPESIAKDWVKDNQDKVNEWTK